MKPFKQLKVAQPKWADMTVAEKQGHFQKLVDVMMEEKEGIIVLADKRIMKYSLKGHN